MHARRLLELHYREGGSRRGCTCSEVSEASGRGDEGRRGGFEQASKRVEVWGSLDG